MGYFMEQSRKRLLYIDNIRLLVIVLVVMHHIAITYSGGMWYYNENANAALDVVSRTFFGFYLSFMQAFFIFFSIYARFHHLLYSVI